MWMSHKVHTNKIHTKYMDIVCCGVSFLRVKGDIADNRIAEGGVDVFGISGRMACSLGVVGLWYRF